MNIRTVYSVNSKAPFSQNTLTDLQVCTLLKKMKSKQKLLISYQYDSKQTCPVKRLRLNTLILVKQTKNFYSIKVNTCISIKTTKNKRKENKTYLLNELRCAQ